MATSSSSTRGHSDKASTTVGQVEIKITIRENQEDHALVALELDRHRAEKRGIYFYDTSSLDMFEKGIVLRAREVPGDNDDSTIKIRPVDRAAIGREWRTMDGFKLESDSVGTRTVLSASLSVRQMRKEIDQVTAGERQISKLFSAAQERLLATFAKTQVSEDDIDRLLVLGPVEALRWKTRPKGLAYEMTAEEWRLPDGTDLLELSIKCPDDEAVVARSVFKAFLQSHGLDPEGAAETKTKTVLSFFAKRRRASHSTE